MFDVFDRPDANASCGRRNVSTTALQSLTLLNSEFSMKASRHLAGVILEEAQSESYEKWIQLAYEKLFSRRETESERRMGIDFLSEQIASLQAEGRQIESLAIPVNGSEEIDPYKGAALVDYCLALFNLNEMIYLD